MVALLKGQRCLDRPLHINLRRIPFDIEARGDELEGGAQVAGQGIPVELGAEEDLDISLSGLTNTVVAEETRLGEQRRLDALACSSPGMRRLHHGAGVGGQPTGMGGRDTQGHVRLGLIESEYLGAGGGSTHRTKQARGMKTT